MHPPSVFIHPPNPDCPIVRHASNHLPSFVEPHSKDHAFVPDQAPVDRAFATLIPLCHTPEEDLIEDGAGGDSESRTRATLKASGVAVLGGVKSLCSI